MGPRRCISRAFVLIFCLAAAGTSSALLAQEAKPKFLIRLRPGQAPVDLSVVKGVNLRPNTATAQSLFMSKSSADELINATVELLQGDTVLAKAKLVDPGKLTTRLAFESAGDKKEGAKVLELQGPPFQLQIRVTAGKRVHKSDVNVDIRDPRSYVDVSLARFDRENSKLHFKLRLINPLIGPRECPVQLVLGPEFAATTKGVFETVLSETGEDVDVFASNLRFKDGTTEGRVSLSVDGYDRAFTFLVNLKDQPARLNIDKQIGVLVNAPRYALPTNSLKIKLELDGPLDAVRQLEVGLDRAGNKTQFQKKTYLGLRQQKLELGFKEGDLVWKTTVTDWEEGVRVAGVLNPIWLKVRVLDKDNQESVLVPFAGADRCRPTWNRTAAIASPGFCSPGSFSTTPPRRTFASSSCRCRRRAATS